MMSLTMKTEKKLTEKSTTVCLLLAPALLLAFPWGLYILPLLL